jgi:hypothetical protein
MQSEVRSKFKCGYCYYFNPTHQHQHRNSPLPKPTNQSTTFRPLINRTIACTQVHGAGARGVRGAHGGVVEYTQHRSRRCTLLRRHRRVVVVVVVAPRRARRRCAPRFERRRVAFALFGLVVGGFFLFFVTITVYRIDMRHRCAPYVVRQTHCLDRSPHRLGGRIYEPSQQLLPAHRAQSLRTALLDERGSMCLSTFVYVLSISSSFA